MAAKILECATKTAKSTKSTQETAILWFVDRYQGTVIAHPAKFAKEDPLGWELRPVDSPIRKNQICQSLFKASWKRFTCRPKAEAYRIRVIEAGIKELIASMEDDSFEQALTAIPCTYPMVN